MLEMMLNPYDYPFWVFIIGILIGVVAIISRPFSTYVAFVYPNAKFEAMGNPFIEAKALQRLVELKTLPDFVEQVNSSKDYQIEGNTAREVQQSLDYAFMNTFQLMRKDSSKKMNGFYDVFLEKIDAAVLKTVLITIHRGETVTDELVEQAVSQKTKTFLLKLQDTKKENLQKMLIDQGFSPAQAKIISDENSDMLAIDTAVDQYIIQKLREVKVPYKCEQGKQEYIDRLLDIQNIKHVLRAKQLSYDEDTCMKLYLGEGREIPTWKFKELCQTEHVSQVISRLEGTSYYEILKNNIEKYNKTRSVQTLTNALDCLFLDIVKDISTAHYVTIGPTIRFLVSKETEIMNLKIIAKGLAEHLPSDTIKDLLITEAGG